MIKKLFSLIVITIILFSNFVYVSAISNESEIDSTIETLYKIEHPVERLKEIKKIMKEITNEIKLKVKLMRGIISYSIKISKGDIKVIYDKKEEIKQDTGNTENSQTASNTVKFGPYHKAYVKNIQNDGKIDFIYKKDLKWYLSLNNQKKFELINEESFDVNNGNYIFTFYKNGKSMININGEEKGPYEYIETKSIQITENGFYVIQYVKDNKTHIDINGQDFGPYDKINSDSIQITDNGKFLFIYKEGEEFKVNINAKVLGPYKNIDAKISNNGNYIISYADEGIDSKNYKSWYVNINGKIVGPINGVVSFGISDNGKYFYNFNKEQKWHINVNGIEYGPHFFNGAKILKNGELFLYYNTNGGTFYEIGGNKFGPFKYGKIRNLDITKNGEYLFSFEKSGGKYANINGKEFGPYDDFKNFQLSGDKKFAFAFKNNNNWYLNLNGKNLGYFAEELDVKLNLGNKSAYSYGQNGMWHIRIKK